MTATLLEPQSHDSPAEKPKANGAVRVLHLINGEHYAGAEKVQDLLGLRLGDFGYEVSFACVKPDQFQRMRQSTGPLIETPMRSRFDLRPAFRIARLIRREGFRLLHTHTPRTALIGNVAARLAGVPMVHHVHGQTASELKRHLFGRISATVERFSLRNAGRIIAVSESLRKYLLSEGVDSKRISVVYNGVPSSAELPPRERPRERWTIGTVALFRPRKGTEILLQSIARLRAQGRDVALRAIGRFETESYENEVHRRVQELGLESHVHWTGFTADVNAELHQVDVMVLPSLLAEGLPMVVIEAMAMGVPAVGTRVDGIVDVIRHDDTGLLAEPGDAESLAEQLDRIIRGDVDWCRLRENGFAWQRERFSDASLAAGVAEIYDQELAG